MNARQRQARGITALLIAAALSGVVSPLEAQRGPTENTPRFVVVTFRGETPAGRQAAEAVRERLQRDVPIRNLWVIPTSDINRFLENSGYSPDDALSASDATALARQLRSDVYLEGTVTPSADGRLTVNPRLVLTRENSIVQPLPPTTVGRAADAAQHISRAVQDARRQLAAEAECVEHARAQQFPQAAAAARAGVAAYPQAVFARVCLANVMAAMKASPDSMLSISQEILKIDPRSRPALRLSYEAYTAKGDQENAIDALTELLAADPSNVELQNAVVNELAKTGNFERAVPIIERALAENPSDPELMNTGFLVFLTAQRWAEAAEIGERLATADTSAMDTTYFVRLAAAYQGDSQPQRASEALARGTAKFPANGGLWVAAAQSYRQAGQLQQSTDALRRALQLDPRTERANLLLAQVYADMNQPDSVVAALQRSQQAGDSSALVSGFALTLANNAWKMGQASKDRNDWQMARRYAEFADQLSPSPEAAFLSGVAAYSIVSSAAAEAQQSKSCELAQLANANVPVVSNAMPRGGRLAPEVAQQAMTFVQQYGPAIEAMAKQYCR